MLYWKSSRAVRRFAGLITVSKNLLASLSISTLPLARGSFPKSLRFAFDNYFNPDSLEPNLLKALLSVNPIRAGGDHMVPPIYFC